VQFHDHDDMLLCVSAFSKWVLWRGRTQIILGLVSGRTTQRCIIIKIPRFNLKKLNQMFNLDRMTLFNQDKISRNAILFILGLIGSEITQYFIIVDRGFLGGDFYMSMPADSKLPFSLGISIFIWIGSYYLYYITKSSAPSKIIIPVTPLILLLYFFNFAITVFGDIGNVLSTTRSPISFLTTLIPVNYLILVNSQCRKLNKKFIVAAIVLIVIDLYRLLLGAVLKVGYILLMRSSRKQILAIVLALPLVLLPIKALVTYKIEARGMAIDNIEDVVVDVVTARIATLSTVHYMVSNAKELAEFSHRPDYSSPWLAAGLSVIPKSIFGLDYVKTNNNWLIEYHHQRPVPDSSVNAPWLMTLYVEALSGYVNFLSYLILTTSLLAAVIKLINYLFGAEGNIFKLWVIFEFMWTGNILHLTIPFYFLCMLTLYIWLKKNYNFRNQPYYPKGIENE